MRMNNDKNEVLSGGRRANFGRGIGRHAGDAGLRDADAGADAMQQC